MNAGDLEAIQRIGLLQEHVAEKLRSYPYLVDVPVLTEFEGDLENKIQQAITKVEAGCYLLVLTPSGKVTIPNMPVPVFDDLTIVIRCEEMPLINRAPKGTNKPATCLAIAALSALHQWTPPGLGACLYATEYKPAQAASTSLVAVNAIAKTLA